MLFKILVFLYLLIFFNFLDCIFKDSIKFGFGVKMVDVIIVLCVGKIYFKIIEKFYIKYKDKNEIIKKIF